MLVQYWIYDEVCAFKSHSNVIPSIKTPDGANGIKLGNKGDIYGCLELSDKQKYKGRFTLIDKLSYDIIIGNDILQHLGFYVNPNGKDVELGGIRLDRVFERSKINQIQTTNILPQPAAALLCITDKRNNCSSEQMETQSNQIENLATSYGRKKNKSDMIQLIGPDNPNLENGTVWDRKIACPVMTAQIRSSQEQPSNDCKKKTDVLCFVDASQEDEEMSQPSISPDTENGGGNKVDTVHLDLADNVKSIYDSLSITDTAVKQQIIDMIIKHKNAFSDNDDDIGLFRSTDGGPSKVTFSLKDPTKVCYSIPRRVPYARREWLEGFLNKLCQSGIITEILYSDDSVHVSPIVIVPKKSGKLRMAVDYRQINANLKLETAPLPHVKDCVEQLARKKYFTALDVTCAFHQLELCEETKKLLGFVTMGKRYVTNRLPFGANGCPSKFQETITRVLKKVNKNNVCPYMDDILIHSVSIEEHIKDIQSTLTEVERHGLKLNPSKCKFFQESTEYLGFIVGKQDDNTYGYSPLPCKIQALQNSDVPETAKDVRSFCGGLQFYNHMLPKLNIMLAPLHKGAAKIPFVMTTEMKDAFKLIKSKLCDKIMLAFPDFTLPFKLSTDASFAGAAGILSQIHEDGSEEIIYTYSKSFDDIQTRWAICELECLALVWSLEKMEVLLMGKQFTWVTDSLVLKNMLAKPPRDLSRTAKKLNRYLDVINGFDIIMRHEKGTNPETMFADFCSRTPIMAIKDLFRIQISKQEWIMETGKDEHLQNMEVQWKNVEKKLFQEDGIVYLMGTPRCKIAVPCTLQKPVMQYYHEQYTIHCGMVRLLSLITGLYFWPNMYADIRGYVRKCGTCLKTKGLPMKKGVKIAIETPSKPWEWIQIDLVQVSNQTSDKGNRYILTAICTLTNYVQMEPIPTKESIIVLKALCKMFCTTGVPTCIQSDNAKEFSGQLMQTHAAWMGVKWIFSTPYKPSTNGRIERRHKDLAKLLKILDSNQNEWDLELPFVVCELNSSIDNITGMTPFLQFHGWDMNVPHIMKEIEVASTNIPFLEWIKNIDMANWESKLRFRQQKIFGHIKEQRQSFKEQAVFTPDVDEQLVPGDTVLVKLPTTGKLANKQTGPFVVTKVTTGGSFHAKHAETGKLVRLPRTHAIRYKIDSSMKPKLETIPETTIPTNVRRSNRCKSEVNYSSFF